MSIFELTYIDSYYPAYYCRNLVLDAEYKVLFAGTSAVLRSFTYTVGAVPTFVEEEAYNGYQLTLDKTTTPRLLFQAGATGDLEMLSYDTLGNMTHIDTAVGVTFPKGVGLDRGRGICFVGEAITSGPFIRSYPYTTAGFGAVIDSSASIPESCTCIQVDTEYRLVFGSSGYALAWGLLSFSYDVNGDNITYVDTANTYSREVNEGKFQLDTTRKFLIDPTSEGLAIYSYDSSGNFSAELSKVTTTNNFTNCEVDTVNRIIYAVDYRQGVKVYQYSEDGTTLTLIDSNNPKNNYYHMGEAYDSINNVLFVGIDPSNFSPGGMISFTVAEFTDCGSDNDTAHQKNIRKFHGKVEVTWTDSFIDNTINATANDSNRVNDINYLIAQTMDGVTAVPRRWAHLDDTIKADGTFYPMPGTTLLAQTNQVGWWGTTECDSNGLWESTTTTTAAP